MYRKRCTKVIISLKEWFLPYKKYKDDSNVMSKSRSFSLMGKDKRKVYLYWIVKQTLNINSLIMCYLPDLFEISL